MGQFRFDLVLTMANPTHRSGPAPHYRHTYQHPTYHLSTPAAPTRGSSIARIQRRRQTQPQRHRHQPTPTVTYPTIPPYTEEMGDPKSYRCRFCQHIAQNKRAASLHASTKRQRRTARGTSHTHTTHCPVCLHEHCQRFRPALRLTHSGTACLRYFITHKSPLTINQISATTQHDRQHNPTVPERQPFPHHATRLYGPLPPPWHLASCSRTASPFIR